MNQKIRKSSNALIMTIVCFSVMEELSYSIIRWKRIKMLSFLGRVENWIKNIHFLLSYNPTPNSNENPLKKLNIANKKKKYIYI